MTVVALVPRQQRRGVTRLVKLVRDRVETFVGEHRVEYRELSSHDHLAALRKKLVEEALEYLLDPSLAELADVYEAIRGLAHHDLRVDMRSVATEAQVKRQERGGFDAGVGLYITTTGG